MVRREEQRWRNRATIFLDSRSRSHPGRGPESSFEAAISAAASVGVHIAQEGLTGQMVTDTATLRGGPLFSDALLDSLAVIRPSSNRNLDQALAELRTASGVIIAILGRLTATETRQVAACRTEGSQGLALLFDVAGWVDDPVPAREPGAGGEPETPGVDTSRIAARPANRRSAEAAAIETILFSAGWHVAVLDRSTPLSVAWELLSQPQAALAARAAGAREQAGAVVAAGGGLPA
jgi:hypothetical protein